MHISDNEKFEAIVLKAILDMDKQGHPSKQGKRCMYRTENGDACIVGKMIPDELYTSVIEDTTLYDKYGEVKKILEKAMGFKLTDEMEKALDLLQELHDEKYKEGKFSDLIVGSFGNPHLQNIQEKL